MAKRNPFNPWDHLIRFNKPTEDGQGNCTSSNNSACATATCMVSMTGIGVYSVPCKRYVYILRTKGTNHLDKANLRRHQEKYGIERQQNLNSMEWAIFHMDFQNSAHDGVSPILLVNVLLDFILLGNYGNYCTLFVQLAWTKHHLDMFSNNMVLVHCMFDVS